MITDFQDRVCAQCAYHHSYFSPVGCEYDRITCTANSCERDGGCDRFKRQ